MAGYDPREFLNKLAPHVLAELRPPAGLKEFTTNPALVGGYVEAGVRQFVRRYLAPIRVSTGAVIDQDQEPGSIKLPQMDMMAWIPGPAPAIFEVGEFALVPRSSCLGVIEVKASAYNVQALAERVDAGFVKSLTAEPLRSEGLPTTTIFGMGIASVMSLDQKSTLLDQLRANGRVAVLFKEGTDGKYEEEPQDVYRLVNFLAMLRYRAAAREGQTSINMDLFR